MNIEAGDTGCLRPATADRILDGAERSLALEGTRGTSMEDIAREAGVTRMTVYRHFASRGKLMGALAAREAERYNTAALALIAEVEAQTPPGENPVPRAILELIQFSLAYLFEHRLVNALMEHEPDAVMPHVSTRADMALGAVVEAQTPLFERWRQEGWLPPVCSAWLIDWLTRLQMSWRFNPSPTVDARDPDTVRRLVETFVLPVIDPGRGRSIDA